MNEFEQVLYELLAGDPPLVGMLATQPEELGGGPGIFANAAPETALFRYVVFSRSGGGGDDRDRSKVARVDVFYSIRVWDEGEDSKPAEEANERIYELLMRERLALLQYTVGTANRVSFITDTQEEGGRTFQVRGARYQWPLLPRYSP